MNQEREDLREGGISGVSFILGVSAGFALGVIGTVLFATYSEDHFGTIVRKTRSVSDKAQDTAMQLKDKVSDTFGDVAESTKKQLKRISGKLDDQIENGSEMVARNS